MSESSESCRLPPDWWSILEAAQRLTGVGCGIAAGIYFAWHGQWGEALLTAAVLNLAARE